jgi:hypothetical protein
VALQGPNQHRWWLLSEQKSTPLHAIHMAKICRTDLWRRDVWRCARKT